MTAWDSRVEIVSATKLSETTACVIVRFPVLQQYLNVAGALMGAAQVAFHDVCTAWALAVVAKPGFWITQGW